MIVSRRTGASENPLTNLADVDLASIYPAPSPRVVAKARPEIDAHAAKFIGLSPFCVLATSGADGSVDASPRGGNPGFVHVISPTQLQLPDRSGNNRIDSFRNIVEGSGKLQLIFFVPGIDETLRLPNRSALAIRRSRWRSRGTSGARRRGLNGDVILVEALDLAVDLEVMTTSTWRTDWCRPSRWCALLPPLRAHLPGGVWRRPERRCRASST